MKVTALKQHRATYSTDVLTPNKAKSQALAAVLLQIKQLGNVTVTVSVPPPNQEEVAARLDVPIATLRTWLSRLERAGPGRHGGGVRGAGPEPYAVVVGSLVGRARKLLHRGRR